MRRTGASHFNIGDISPHWKSLSYSVTVKSTAPDKVVAAVIKAIRRDIAELTVNPIPMRPVSILREIFTGITPYIHKIFGVTESARKL